MTNVIDRPPLYLQTYLEERQTAAELQQLPSRGGARVVSRHENVIEVDFADVSRAEPMLQIVTHRRRRRLRNGWWDAAVLLLLIASAVGSILSLAPWQ